ncbi:unnamed protein product [Prorocentrum cordatum]|uniref:DUF1501 domain-containing protein n=1 Tax=Prorocentrum cordatum TaxID=2364126 RepID=A0ABN9PF40_9DINO|nr:unnamed protein product [Polarella glacialis]
MRSMEFTGLPGRMVIMKDLSKIMGEFPYQQPTVFNFYLPQYAPDGLPDGMVAPEFQIFDAPLVVSFAEAMISMIKNQGLSDYDGGYGIPSWNCKGSFRLLKNFDTMEELWSQMDLLLTGGRLGPMKEDIVSFAGTRVGDSVCIQSAQYAVVLSPHFHTLGGVLPEGPRSPLGDHGSATSSSAGYKAMVVLYLFGGVGSFNMPVPLECALYDQYVSIRKTVALQPSQLLEINSDGQACTAIGIHGQLTIVKELYDDGDAAFVTNVGNLNEPRLGHPSARTCPGGFSHNDMQHASQTLYCQIGMNFKNGGGGRMADALAASQVTYSVKSFSLSGQAAWSEGQVTKRSVISGTQTEGGFHPDPRAQRIINNLTTVELSSIYAKEYINAFGESVNSFNGIQEALESGDSLLQIPANNYGWMEQLKQVARLVAARTSRFAERDFFFFVGFGGFDMHSNLEGRLFSMFGTMDMGIRAFVNEMKAQGIWENVLLATQSDFARTLDPNADMGTDHAWAGNHFILSGAVNGGRIYNQFPEPLAAGNPADLGRGRLIPKYPYESYMVPIAKWLGVEYGRLGTVFPNFPNFNSSFIIPQLNLISS